MEVLASRLKWLREKKRVSQREVAESINISLNGYGQMEYNKNNPKLETLIHLAKYYDVSTDFLLGLNDRHHELDELIESYQKNLFTIEECEEKLKHLKRGIFTLKQSMQRMPRDNESVSVRKQSLLVKEIEKENLEEQIFLNMTFLNISLLEIIKHCLSVPYADLTTDPIVSKYSPYEFHIDKATEEERYFLSIYAEEIGQLGVYKEYPSYEEANTDKLILMIQLNTKYPDNRHKYRNGSNNEE